LREKQFFREITALKNKILDTEELSAWQQLEKVSEVGFLLESGDLK